MTIFLCFLRITGSPILKRHWTSLLNDLSMCFTNDMVHHVEIFFPRYNEMYSSCIDGIGVEKRNISYYNKFNEEASWELIELTLSEREEQKIYQFCTEDMRLYGEKDRYDLKCLISFGLFTDIDKMKYTCTSYVFKALNSSNRLKREINRHVSEKQWMRIEKHYNPDIMYNIICECIRNTSKYFKRYKTSPVYYRTANRSNVVNSTNSFFITPNEKSR